MVDGINNHTRFIVDLRRFFQRRISEQPSPLDDNLIDIGDETSAVAQLVAICLQLIDIPMMVVRPVFA